MCRAVRPFVFGLLALALFALGSCSRGENIPVQPVGPSLDAIPDPFFRRIAPLNDHLSQYDCVQLEDGRAWIVGQDGMILGRGSNGVWYREESPTDSSLLRVVAGPDGRLWGVGYEGTVLVHDQGGWSVEPTGVEQVLREIRIGVDEIWAVGNAGTVLRRTAGVWESVDCPVESDLNGVWFDAGTEAVFVCGNGGVMLRYADGAWTDESAGPWETQDLLSVVRPEGGNPVTVSRAQSIDFDLGGYSVLYERTPGGWQAMEMPQEVQGSWIHRLKAVGSDLWIEKSWGGVVRLQPGAGAWVATEYMAAGHFGMNLSVGVAAGRDLLLTSSSGGINWIDAEGRATSDPAGELGGVVRLFRMADGSSGFVDERGLFYWRDGRLQAMGLDYGDGVSAYRLTEAVDGLSVDDFFVSAQDGLYHMVDGTAVLHLELERRPGELDLAVGGEGDLFIVQNDGVYHLPPGGSTLELIEDPQLYTPEIRRLRSGRVAGWDWIYCDVFENGVWTVEELQMQLSPSFVWEAADGVFGMYNASFYLSNTSSLHFWRPGTPGTTVVSRLVPGDTDLSIRDLRVGKQGLYACTREPSRIFRLDDSDPLAGRWDAVTGLYAGYAGDFLPLDDGSLLVIDDRTNEILLYRDRDAD